MSELISRIYREAEQAEAERLEAEPLRVNPHNAGIRPSAYRAADDLRDRLESLGVSLPDQKR